MAIRASRAERQISLSDKVSVLRGPNGCCINSVRLLDRATIPEHYTRWDYILRIEATFQEPTIRGAVLDTSRCLDWAPKTTAH